MESKLEDAIALTKDAIADHYAAMMKPEFKGDGIEIRWKGKTIMVREDDIENVEVYNFGQRDEIPSHTKMIQSDTQPEGVNTIVIAFCKEDGKRYCIDSNHRRLALIRQGVKRWAIWSFEVETKKELYHWFFLFNKKRKNPSTRLYHWLEAHADPASISAVISNFLKEELGFTIIKAKSSVPKGLSIIQKRKYVPVHNGSIESVQRTSLDAHTRAWTICNIAFDKEELEIGVIRLVSWILHTCAQTLDIIPDLDIAQYIRGLAAYPDNKNQYSQENLMQIQKFQTWGHPETQDNFDKFVAGWNECKPTFLITYSNPYPRTRRTSRSNDSDTSVLETHSIE